MVRAGSARSTSVTAAKRSGERRRISERTSFQRSEILRLRLRMTASFTLTQHLIRHLPVTPSPRRRRLLAAHIVGGDGTRADCRGRRPRRPVVRHNNPSVSLRDPQNGLTWSQRVAVRFLLLPVRPALPLRSSPHCGREAFRPLHREGFWVRALYGSPVQGAAWYAREARDLPM